MSLDEAGGLDLWLIDLSAAAPALMALESQTPRLARDELARAVGLGPAGNDWRALRIAMRVVLERHAGASVRRTPWRVGPAGKPSLPWVSEIDFSLSHSGRHALLAVGRRAVGVDLEEERSVAVSAERRAALLAAASVPSLRLASEAAGDGGSCAEAVLQAWTRLEAWAKARGTGIGALLGALGIRGPRLAVRSVEHVTRAAADLLSRDGFEIRDIPLPAGLHGAVAARPPLREWRARRFPVVLADIEALCPGG